MSMTIRLTAATLDILHALAGASGGEVYGLEIAQTTRRPTGTVYPVLSRLERHGWVSSAWDISDQDQRGPRRRYYRLTSQGQHHLRALMEHRARSEREGRRNPVHAPIAGPHVIHEFVRELRLLRLKAGEPSLRSLGATTFYSPAALSEAFAGRSLPSVPLLRAIAIACSADPEEWSVRRGLAEQSLREGVRIPFDFGDFCPLGMRWVTEALDGDPDEDLIQDVMLAAYERWETLRSSSDIRASIVRLTRSRVSEAARERRELPVAEAGPDNAADPEEIAERRLTTIEILRKMGPANARMVILRSEGYTVEEIAALLGTTSPAVNARFARLRAVARTWEGAERDLVAYLAQLRASVGNPSIRWLATRMKVSHTTVHRLVSGAERGRQLQRLIEALGGSLREAERWTDHVTRRPRADTDDVYDLWARSEKLEKAGRAVEAAELWRPAAEAGDVNAMWVLADKLDSARRPEEAESWLAAAAEQGDLAAAKRLATRLEEMGRPEDAYQVLHAAAVRGEPSARSEASRLLQKLGRPQEAYALWREAAREGDPHAMRQLSALLLRTGQGGAACEVWRRAASAGDVLAMRELARTLDEIGEQAEAETWLRRVAALHDVEGTIELSATLERRGAVAEAELWLVQMVEGGDSRALPALSGLLERKGEPHKAGRLWEPLAESGNRHAMWSLAGLYDRAGLTEQAAMWRRRASANSDLPVSVGPRASVDQLGEALLRRQVAAGNLAAPLALADLLSASGRTGEAVVVLRQATEHGNVLAASALAAHVDRRPSGQGTGGQFGAEAQEEGADS